MARTSRVARFGLAIGLCVTGLWIAWYACSAVDSWREGERLARERSAASEASARMGYGGGYYVIVHTPTGAYNRIELTFRRGKKIGDDQVRYLEGLTGIWGVDLSDTSITDNALRSLATLPDLRYVQVSGTQVTDAGLKHLAKATKLEALDLTSTHVTQAGARYLEQLANLKKVFAAGTALRTVRGVSVDTTTFPPMWAHEDGPYSAPDTFFGGDQSSR